MGQSILALDFDGVICDGMAEYLHSSWLVYCQIWSASGEPSPQVSQDFYRWRPLIEYGWEMPLLVWAIVQQVPAIEIEQGWSQVVQTTLAAEKLTAADITKVMDEVRDQQIATDLRSWLALQRCYPGTINRLHSLPPEIAPIIITTKDGRFTRQMLENSGIDLPPTAIFGKETKQPKTFTLAQILAEKPDHLWFVEDRLPTLESVINQPGLDSVQLFLADWGYNTLAERQAAAANPRITVLSLDRFSQDLSCWT